MFLSDQDRAAIARLRDAELRALNNVAYTLDWNDVRRIRLLAEQADKDEALLAQKKLGEQLDDAEQTVKRLRERERGLDRQVLVLRGQVSDLQATLDAVKKALRPKKPATTRPAHRPKASPT